MKAKDYVKIFTDKYPTLEDFKSKEQVLELISVFFKAFSKDFLEVQTARNIRYLPAQINLVREFKNKFIAIDKKITKLYGEALFEKDAFSIIVFEWSEELHKECKKLKIF